MTIAHVEALQNKFEYQIFYIFFASQERDYQGSLGSPKFLTKWTINGAAL